MAPPARPTSPPVLLTTTRQLLGQQLEAWLAAFATSLADDLLALADATTDRQLQTRQFDLRLKVQRQWPEFVQRFAFEFKALDAEPQALLSIPDFAGLELVDDAALAESIVVRELSLRLCESANEALYGLNHRVAHLQGLSEPDLASNPLAPRPICEALFAACAALGLTSDDSLLLLRRIERPLHQALPPIYETLNAELIAAGILPELRRAYGSPARKTANPRREGTAYAADQPSAASAASAYSLPQEIAASDDPWSALQQLIRLRACSNEHPRSGTAFPPGQVDHRFALTTPQNGNLASDAPLPQLTDIADARPRWMEQARHTCSTATVFDLATAPEPAPAANSELRTMFWRSLDELQRLPVARLNPRGQQGSHEHSSMQPSASLDDVTINLVRQIREQQAGMPPNVLNALGHIEAVTIDIVAMLFDFIFDDPDIPLPVKALVSRLQIPVLKTAMLDHRFFADRQHPARQFLDGIAGVCTRWGNEVAADDLLHLRLTELVAQIQLEFSEDPEVFRVALEALEAVVAEQDLTAADTVKVGMAHIAEKEARAQAELRANALLSPLLQTAMPAVVRDFLLHHWMNALSAAAARYAAQPAQYHAEWERYSQTATDLLWSINAKLARKDRLRLLSLLPHLLADIQQGLDAAAIPRSACSSFFDHLVQLHAAALKGNEAEMELPAENTAALEMPDPDALVVTRSIAAGVVIEEIRLATENQPAQHSPSPATAAPPTAAVATLKRGDWVEFIDADGHTMRERLNWVSPQRGILMFSNHREAKAISISPAALQRQIEAGQARIVVTQPLFEHALSGVLTELCASQTSVGSDATPP